MRTIEKKILKANELGKQALIKAYSEFLEFTESTHGKGSHNVLEFIEVSNINNWEYNEDGTLFSED